TPPQRPVLRFVLSSAAHHVLLQGESDGCDVVARFVTRSIRAGSAADSLETPEQSRGRKRRCRNGEDPGPAYPACYAPAHGRKPRRRAHSNNRAGNGV